MRITRRIEYVIRRTGGRQRARARAHTEKVHGHDLSRECEARGICANVRDLVMAHKSSRELRVVRALGRARTHRDGESRVVFCCVVCSLVAAAAVAACHALSSAVT